MFEQLFHDVALHQGYTSAALAAAQEAFSLKHRLSHPPGAFDKAGRFTLHERGVCCDGLRSPSIAYPHSEMLHGRSITHVAHLHGVPKLHVQRLVRALEVSTPRPPSSHADAQVLVMLRHILKPVRGRSRPAA